MKTLDQVLSTGPWQTSDGAVTVDQARAWFDSLPDMHAARKALGVETGTDRRWDQTVQRFRRAGLVCAVRDGIRTRFERVANTTTEGA